MNDEITRIEQKLAEAWAARELAQMRADCAQNIEVRLHYLSEMAQWDIVRQQLYYELDKRKGQRNERTG